LLLLFPLASMLSPDGTNRSESFFSDQNIPPNLAALRPIVVSRRSNLKPGAQR